MEEKTAQIKLDNEKMLVEQAKTDDRAFEVLYDFYFPKIYFFVLKRIGQKEATEDVVSATFMKVFTGLKVFEAKNNHSFAAWVYRIASNKLTDYYRSQGRRPVVDIASVAEPEDESQDPEADFVRRLNKSIVEKILSRLSVRDQQVLQLKFFAELDNIEIAQALGTKPNNVGVWLYRALKRFRTIYQQYE
jgi:RNA polymerase sigma-70 factor (ECF subfamily)